MMKREETNEKENGKKQIKRKMKETRLMERNFRNER